MIDDDTGNAYLVATSLEVRCLATVSVFYPLCRFFLDEGLANEQHRTLDGRARADCWVGN